MGSKTEVLVQGIHNNLYVMNKRQHQYLIDIISQAAAAGNILPTFIEKQHELRPFLCPGCSNLYVREATFRKHFEKSKLKLQEHITQVVSSLGLPTSAMLDFNAINLLPIPHYLLHQQLP